MYKTICTICKKISVMDGYTFHSGISNGTIKYCGTDKIDGYEDCEKCLKET